MQTFDITARLVSGNAGLQVMAPDGSPVAATGRVTASAAHVAVNIVVKRMSAKYDKVMQRYYNAPPRMGVGDRLVITVDRIN